MKLKYVHTHVASCILELIILCMQRTNPDKELSIVYFGPPLPRLWQCLCNFHLCNVLSTQVIGELPPLWSDVRHICGRLIDLV